MTSYNKTILDIFFVKCKLCGEEAKQRDHLMGHCGKLKTKKISKRGTDEERRRGSIRDRLYELGSYFDPGI